MSRHYMVRKQQYCLKTIVSTETFVNPDICYLISFNKTINENFIKLRESQHQSSSTTTRFFLLRVCCYLITIDEHFK